MDFLSRENIVKIYNYLKEVDVNEEDFKFYDGYYFTVENDEGGIAYSGYAIDLVLEYTAKQIDDLNI